MSRIIKRMLTVIVILSFVAGCGKEPPKQSRKPVPQVPETAQSNTPAPTENTITQTIQEGAKTAQAALAFTLKDQTGKDVRLSDYAGKVVVLEWINPDCPFVQAHYKAGTMVGLARRYAEKGVVWLGVNSTNSATAAINKAFVDAHSLPYPVLDDHAGIVGRLFGAKTTPHLFVLDTKGQIAYQGAIDNAPMGKVAEGQKPVNYVDQALSELLKGVPVTLARTDSYGCSVKF